MVKNALHYASGSLRHKFIICFSMLLSTALLVGCARPQLEYNTVDVSTSIDSIYTKQVLYNMSRFIDDPQSIPSMVDLSAGTIQTVDTIQPSVSFPFTSQIASTVTSAAATITTANARTLAGSSAGLSATNTQQQNLNIVPLIQENLLRNLQALYRYEVNGASLDNGDYTPSRLFVNQQFVLDPYDLLPPHCVLCASSGDNALKTDISSLSINPKLVYHSWLYWDNGSGIAVNYFGQSSLPLNDLKSLGRFNNHDLYIKKSDYENGYLTQFVLFLMPNTGPSESFPQPKQTDTGKGGAGGAPPAATAPAPSQDGRVAPAPGRNQYSLPAQSPGIQF